MSVKNHALQLALVVTICLCNTLHSQAAPPGGENSPQKSAVQWEIDIHAAHAASIKSGKPILIVFTAGWCRYCRQLEQETINHPKMTQYINQNFIPLELDLDRDSKLATILEVKSIPCTLILSPEADLLGRHIGFDKPVNYYDKLTAARKLQDRVQRVNYQTAK